MVADLFRVLESRYMDLNPPYSASAYILRDESAAPRVRSDRVVLYGPDEGTLLLFHLGYPGSLHLTPKDPRCKIA